MRFLAFLAVATLAVPAFALEKGEMLELLQELDRRQSSVDDYKALTYIVTKERGKDDMAFEAVIYRRDENDQLMILFVKPKSEQGKGYLHIDRNLWMYDPSIGQWERRTARERIMGTDSRRTDFDESRLAEDYVPTDLGDTSLGRLEAHHLRLDSKFDADVPYPVTEIWVDKESKNVLKRQDFAASGKLMRTTYTPRWKKIKGQEKEDHVWYPKEIRIFDEVEEGNSTFVVVESVDLTPLPANIFTKAWLESKSR